MTDLATWDAPDGPGFLFCRSHCYQAAVSQDVQENRDTEFSIYLNHSKGTQEGERKNFYLTEVYAFFRDDLIFTEVILNGFSAIK